jgi:hypothetical protein
MKRVLTLAIAIALQVSAQAADVVPAHLTGTWGTAESLYAGTAAQNEMMLQANGFGLIAGSGTAPRRLDGVDDGKPALRAIIGFPVRATVDGDTLTARPFLPAGAPADQAAKLASAVISCRYSAAGPTLTCTGPDGVAFAMHRRSETIPEEAATMIGALAAQSGTP